MKPYRFFEGDLLKGTLFRPRRRKLFVSFRQRLETPGSFDEPAPVLGLTARGFAHLHLQTRWNDWYINEETPALEEALAEFGARFDEVICIGFSMGGYAALRFAGALGTQRLIAVSPQVDIDPARVPSDRRYRHEARGWDAEAGDLARHPAAVRGAVLVDPFKPLDLMHGRRACALFPGLSLVRLPCGGHPATRVLRQGGRFDWLKADFAEGRADPRAILQAHRGVRRRSESYWRHLAEVARGHGHTALAEEAEARASELVQ